MESEPVWRTTNSLICTRLQHYKLTTSKLWYRGRTSVPAGRGLHDETPVVQHTAAERGWINMRRIHVLCMVVLLVAICWQPAQGKQAEQVTNSKRKKHICNQYAPLLESFSLPSFSLPSHANLSLGSIHSSMNAIFHPLLSVFLTLAP